MSSIRGDSMQFTASSTLRSQKSRRYLGLHLLQMNSNSSVEFDLDVIVLTCFKGIILIAAIYLASSLPQLLMNYLFTSKSFASISMSNLR